MFLAVVCSVMMGISRRLGDFLMKMLAINLRVAFEQTNQSGQSLSLLQQDILGALPKTIDTALSHFDLDVKTTVYAVCEVCHCTYAPTYTPRFDHRYVPKGMHKYTYSRFRSLRDAIVERDHR